MKRVARALASLLVLPAVLSMQVRAAIVGKHRALAASCEWLALIPGLAGQYLRRAFLAAAAECGPEVVIGFGTLFSSADVRLDVNAYVGPHCDIGWAHLERDVMLAAGVHVPSGPHVHGSARLDVPMRDQPGQPVCVHIREGAWIGNRAVIMADVGRHAIVAAGAVVTHPVPDFAIVAGVPARLIRDRREAGALTASS